MPFNKFLLYLEAIDQLHAQETLLKLNIIDYPKMKENGRNKFHRNLFLRAYPDQKEKTVSTEELFKVLSNG